MKKTLLIILSLVLCCTACHKKEKVATPKLTPKQESQVKNLEINIVRYDQMLFNLDPNNLAAGVESLYGKVPEILIAKDCWKDAKMMKSLKGYLTDQTIKDIYKETQKQYPNLNDLEQQLSEAFKIYLTHFPDDTLPQIYAMVSGLDFSIPSAWGYGNSMFINLDMYLGKDYKYYEYAGMPKFVSARCTRNHIPTDCFTKVMAYRHLPDKTLVTLLDNMIYEGKKLFLTQTMFPNASKQDIIGYDNDKYNWIVQHEGQVWQFFIEKNLLYSKDEDAIRRFIDETPFTRDFGNNSPGRAGAYLGWRIIQSYMKQHPEITLAEIMSNPNAQKILTESFYKPSLKK